MFASTLTQLRIDAGLSQQQVAERLGMARATYANLETGKKSPTLVQLQAISELFEVGTERLVGGDVVRDGGTTSITPASLHTEQADIGPRAVVTENVEALREVLLYVLDKVGAKPNVGETVLYKLLYFIDFDYYEKHGKSITGLQYIKNHYGPTPTSTFSSVTKGMQEIDELEVVETEHFNYRQRKYLPVVKPGLKSLSAEELRHIDEVLARLSDKTAAELSSLSHRDMPWIATEEGAPIDYRLAMYRTADTSVKEPGDEL